MTTQNKLTYTQALEMVLEIQEVKENAELLAKMIQLNNQMNKKSGKLSKAEKEKQEENESIKLDILEVLESDELKAKSIKEMQLERDSLQEFSNQKISALIRQLIVDSQVIRIEEKRIAKFFKA